MNAYQKEMLSVKNAIERMVQGQISSFSKNPDTNSADLLFSQVDRFIAGLYVSGQIESVYSVSVTGGNQLEISFGCAGQKSTVTFLLPRELSFRKEAAPSQVELSLISDIADIRFDLSDSSDQVINDLAHFQGRLLAAATDAMMMANVEETSPLDITYIAFGEWEEVAKAEEIKRDIADGTTARTTFDDMSQRLVEWYDERYVERLREEAAVLDQREADDLTAAYERAKKVR